ncbi:MAG: DUF445 family protein [Syntrophorhabdales bacterium]|jgi:hypothetical protein
MAREDGTIPKTSGTAEFGREQERALKRMKLFATGLLVLMVVTYWVCRMFERRHPLLGFVAAFSEAGTIGALADWFAVVALFRHPLNLPIPRTAIIPRNRDRIGESLARFIEENFLEKGLLEKKMATVDLAGLLATWLSEERNALFIAERAAEYIPSFLHEQGNSQDAAGRADPQEKGLSTFLRGAADAVWRKPFVRKAATGFLSGLDRVGLPLYHRVLEPVGNAISGARKRSRPQDQEADPGAVALLGNAGPDSNSFSATDAPKGKADRTSLAWKILRERLIRDLASPDSEFVGQVAAFIREAGQGIFAREDLKERINQGLRAWISGAVHENKELFALFISETVKKWDPEATSRRIELHVGRDLQWIRINGTIVGGLAGLLIYFLSFIFRGLP